MHRRFRISPALLVATLALFFALGGSAFALGEKVLPQPKCAQGAIRGIAEVTGQPAHGIANVPDTYTASPTYFQRRFNCTGGTIEVKRPTTGTFDVKFLGNPATSAVVSAMGPDPDGATVARQPDGSFEVIVGSHAYPVDEGFTIALL